MCFPVNFATLLRIPFLQNTSRRLLLALSEKLEKILPDLIPSQQSVYVKSRHIGKNGRLIPDVTEIAKIKKLKGVLVAMDIEEALDSLDHNNLISILEK